MHHKYTMLYPTLESRLGLPYVPSIYPGQDEDWIMSLDYFRHHSTWMTSQNLQDQLALFVHCTPYDIRQVQKHHAKRMRTLARMNGYDVASRFELMSIKLLRRYEEDRAMTVY